MNEDDHAHGLGRAAPLTPGTRAIFLAVLLGACCVIGACPAHPLLAQQEAAAVKDYGSLVAPVDHAHDVDTLIVNVPGVPPVFGELIEVRLQGYDGPELLDPRPEIRAISQRGLARVKQLIPKGTSPTFTHLKRDKYFRINAVWILKDGTNVGALLESEGLVRPYSGRGPKPW